MITRQVRPQITGTGSNFVAQSSQSFVFYMLRMYDYTVQTSILTARHSTSPRPCSNRNNETMRIDDCRMGVVGGLEIPPSVEGLDAPPPVAVMVVESTSAPVKEPQTKPSNDDNNIDDVQTVEEARTVIRQLRERCRFQTHQTLVWRKKAMMQVRKPIKRTQPFGFERNQNVKGDSAFQQTSPHPFPSSNQTKNIPKLIYFELPNSFSPLFFFILVFFFFFFFFLNVKKCLKIRRRRRLDIFCNPNFLYSPPN